MSDSIEDLWKAIIDANEQLMKCSNATGEARRNETAALNSLNKLQKEFDQLLSQKRGQMHRESDWNTKPSIGVVAERKFP